jgi:hypothetical protein
MIDPEARLDQIAELSRKLAEAIQAHLRTLGKSCKPSQ